MNNIWLASFPRSGNTFLRNILFHVYGINSLEDEKYISPDSKTNQFVKTHDLPFQLKNYDRKTDKVVYIVRDGRDSICSLAHKRKNIIDVNSDLDLNFKEAILAEKGSFFGGWGYNISFWLKENPMLIRFEDLIKDPKMVFEQVLEPQLNLPSANWAELPTFEKQKKGLANFGGASRGRSPEFSNSFFRKGKVGAWKNDLKPDYKQLFINLYSNYLQAFGYEQDGSIRSINQWLIDEIRKDDTSRLKFRMQLKFWNLKDALKSRIKNGI